MSKSTKEIESTSEFVTKPVLADSVVLNITNKFRWSKEVFYDGSLDCYVRILKQLFLDEKGGEHWIKVEVEA